MSVLSYSHDQAKAFVQRMRDSDFTGLKQITDEEAYQIAVSLHPEVDNAIYHAKNKLRKDLNLSILYKLAKAYEEEEFNKIVSVLQLEVTTSK